MDEDPVKIVGEGIARLRDRALDRGFKLPLYLTLVSADGVMMFHRYTSADGESDKELIVEKLADHWPINTLHPPYNIMLTDSTGQIALLRVQRPEGEAEPEVIWPNELPSD